jgi:hypothetical protein
VAMATRRISSSLSNSLRLALVASVAVQLAGCRTWQDIGPKGITVGDSVRLDKLRHRVVLTGARVCEGTHMLSGHVTRADPELLSQLIQEPWVCLSRPCAGIDMSDAVVQVKRDDGGRVAAFVVLGVVGAVAAGVGIWFAVALLTSRL